MGVVRTTELFVQSVMAATDELDITISKSRTRHGASNYVTLTGRNGRFSVSVRISDHPIGMRRARRHEHALLIMENSAPSSWAVWLSQMLKHSKIPQKEQNPWACATA